MLTEQREIEDGERHAQARRRLNTVGDDDDLGRQRATKDESMEAQPAGQEGDLERLRTTTVAQTRALQKLDALHANTIILQKRGKETPMREFYPAVDHLTTELGNTVLNEIASISPQGASVVIHVEIQTSRRRILDKVHNWIATKNKTTIMTTCMGDRPLKQMVAELPRAAYPAVMEVLGQGSKKDLLTRWPGATYQAEWSIPFTDGDCIAAAKNTDEELITTICYKKTVKHNSRNYDGEVIAKLLREKLNKSVMYVQEFLEKDAVRPAGKKPRSLH